MTTGGINYKLQIGMSITVTVFAHLFQETQIPQFWPFPTETYSFKSNKGFGSLIIITPVIVFLGVISLILLLFKEFEPEQRRKLVNWNNFGRNFGLKILT